MPRDYENNFTINEKGRRISLDRSEGERHLFAEMREISDEVKTHWHTYFELEIITGGSATHILNGEEYTESRGSVYLLNPTDFHSVKPSEPLSLYNVSFDEEILSDRRLFELLSDNTAKRFTLEGDSLSRVLSLADLIRAECPEADGGCSRELCESLLTILMRNRSQKQTEYGSYQLSGIRKALLYLDLHFRENPSLEAVAAQAGFHKNYFSEIFKRVTGESYTTRLNTLRTSYAKSLLASGFSVTEACYNSGFGSLSNFLATFKKFVGTSPEEFKKSVK